MENDILGEFARFRRRHRWVRGTDFFLEAAFVTSLAAAALLMVDRLSFELGWSLPHVGGRFGVALTLAGSLAVSLVATLAAMFLRPVSPARLAWQIDRAANAEERILSALEMAAAGDGSPFALVLCRDAARLAREAEPARILPRPTLRYRWAIALSLATGGLLWAYPPQLYDAPIADLEASPLRGPAPMEVFFQDYSIGAIDEFLWDYGDGATASGEKSVHVYAKPGKYEARLFLRGPGGSSEKRCTIEVLPPDQAVADFRGKPLKGRGSLEVSFENLSKNAKKTSWDFGDGEGSSDEQPVHTYKTPGLFTVRLTVENDLGRDEKIREKYVKVAHPDEPIADFRGMPREGEAPLSVEFEDLTSGVHSEWFWDFGDLPAGAARVSNERNPVHVYKTPGHYTVRLRVKGPRGEDEDEKLRYIHVTEPGSGKGGGAQNKQQPKPSSPKNPKGAGQGEGKLLGDPSERPKVTLIPEELKHKIKPGTRLEEKTLNVYTNKDPQNGQGAPKEVPLEQVLPQFQRAAEDAMERELIPPAYRDHVRRYYEDLRPK